MKLRLVACACVLLASAVIEGTEVGLPSAPVVVVVDSSRSLSPAELGLALNTLQQALSALPGETRSGLVEFNDASRWVAPLGASPKRVINALAGLSPSGRHSVLRDALIVASREFDQGGVILVATDGKDENSAATVSDVAQFVANRNVRLVTIGLGRSLDVRMLRRLSLLSGGDYLGSLEQVTAPAVAAAVVKAQHSVVLPAREAIVQTPTPGASAVAPVTVPAQATENAKGVISWFPILIGMLVMATALVTLFVWRMRKGEKARVCPDCGREMAAWETSCSFCKLDRLQLESAQEKRAVVGAHEFGEEDDGVLFDPSLFLKEPTQEQLDKTFSLQEQALLVVRQNRKPLRTFVLDPSRVVAVGRASSVNTIAIDDPTVSAQHFKIVPKDGDYFVLDLGATNGTVVNGERTRVHRLRGGDVISSGQVEIEYRTQFVRPN